MNKKELAKEIFNHPMMKVLRESKGVDNKALIRILAEEINEQYLLDEAPRNTLSNYLTKRLATKLTELGSSDPETLTAAVNDIVSNFINQIRDEKELPKLFTNWDKWSDERKQNMIAAGQKYNPKVEPRIKAALAKYAEDGQIDAGEAEEAAAVILEPIAAQLEDDNELQTPDVNPEQSTEILNKFLDIVAQVLKGSPLQEQEVKDKEFGKSIMAFLEAAEVNPEQVEQIKTKLGEVELDLRVVDQALATEGAVEKALEGLKQRLAPTEPEEAPAQPEEADAEATPENEDLEELPKAELQRKMLAQSIEPVDKFFDDTDGFLKQLLLSDQGKLLRDMIVGLGKIERGDLGEDLALTDIVVVPDEPDPQPETKPDEGETDSEPPEKADVSEQMQEQEEPQVPANAKARRMVKNEVAAIRDLLKDVVAVAKRYEQNATRTNIDSRFDGTKLKSVFDEKLEATQRQIARLVAIIGKVMEEAMADKAGEQLQEQDAQTRQEKIKLVQDTYRDLMRLYKNSFQVQAGEKFDFAKTQQAARNMINIVDDSGIVAFYPRITNFDATTGQVITLGQAYEEMTKLVKKLAKTTADIFLNVRDGEVEVNNMQRAILDLQDISSAIENYYGIKSMIRAKDVAKIDPDQLESFGYELSPGEEIDMPIDPGKDEPIPTADVEVIDEPDDEPAPTSDDETAPTTDVEDEETPSDTPLHAKSIATAKTITNQIKGPFNERAFRESREGLEQIFLEDTPVNSAMIASMAALITAMSRDISKPLQEDLINKFLNANESTWASKESIKAGLESLKKNVDEKSFRLIVNNLAQLYRLDNGSIMSKNSKKIAALFTEIAKLRASSSPSAGATAGAPDPAAVQGGDPSPRKSVPTRVVKPRKKTRRPADMEPGEDLQSYLARKASERGGASGGFSNLEEQLTNKLIPIVESILKD